MPASDGCLWFFEQVAFSVFFMPAFPAASKGGRRGGRKKIRFALNRCAAVLPLEGAAHSAVHRSDSTASACCSMAETTSGAGAFDKRRSLIARLLQFPASVRGSAPTRL